MKCIIIFLCLFYVSCDAFHAGETKLTRSDSLLFWIRMKAALDECPYPSNACNGNMLQACQEAFPANHYIDVQDCTATGLTCWFYGREAECR